MNVQEEKVKNNKDQGINIGNITQQLATVILDLTKNYTSYKPTGGKCEEF